MFYERSALMAADIYTKAFAGAPEWQTVMKLVNHLDPDLFWKGPGAGRKASMPSEHKGGVFYDYWTPNPWHAQPEDRGMGHKLDPSPAGDEWHAAFHGEAHKLS